MDTLAAASAVTFQIPRSSRQLTNIVRDLRGVDEAFARPTFRLLTRKLCKALDDSCMEIASLTQRTEQLAAALESQKPQKRRKVRPTAQERFVAIQDVVRVKREMGILPDEPDLDSDREGWIDQADCEEENNSEVEECIIVS